jgi:hypothetical protein
MKNNLSDKNLTITFRSTVLMKPISQFGQSAFGPTVNVLRLLPLGTQTEAWLFDRLLQMPLSLQEAISLPQKYKRAVHGLLCQYTSVLYMNKYIELPFDILEGTSQNELGVPLMRYMAENRWPFPHMLHRYKADRLINIPSEHGLDI